MRKCLHVSPRKITDERWEKTHRYWSVVENRRVSGRRVVQRQVLYLEEFNDTQRAGWVRTIEALWGEKNKVKQLTGEDDSLAQKDKPYRCLDLLLEHRDDLFGFLKGQWGKLLGAKYDVLLYDLTSTYFESDPPSTGSGGKKRFGYSRDKRSDCVQVVVALVLTPEGFPVAYEVYPGNTRDTATLEKFLDRIEKQYGKFRRTWLMDRGIPTRAISLFEAPFFYSTKIFS
ncbi:MAG: IS1634 family transposase [Candidatus Brocadia sp. AMX1]|nr:IS1634 family transposase [Candidatus Brocadia sp. AMX1]